MSIKIFTLLTISSLMIIVGTLTAYQTNATCAQTEKPAISEQERLSNFLEKVYKTMDDHYYLPVSRETYEKFVQTYTAPRLRALNNKAKKTEDFVHLGAGLLVMNLKDPSDPFTNFVPPKKTKEFKEKAYAVTEDLGIEGTKTAKGYEITRVQKHAEAFAQGIRKNDIIKKIDGIAVMSMEPEAIKKALTPAVGTACRLEIFFIITGLTQEISLVSKSYFRETVFTKDSRLPGVFILQISHFNEKTSEDFADLVNDYGVDNVKRLILDLRNNEGGPPLAAREILGFFLPPNDMLFGIARKKQRPVMLTSPPQKLILHCPMTVLVNHGTGSAAEMFSGLLQAKQLGQLVGQKTAGATYLKSIYDFDDGSMVFMITSLTFFFNRRIFPSDGLTPDIVLPDNQDALEIVLQKLQHA